MHRTARTVLSVLVSTLIFTLVGSTAGGATDRHAERPAAGVTDSITTSPGYALVVPGLSAALAERDVFAVASYVHDLDARDIAAYAAAVEQSEREAALAQYLAALPKPAATPHYSAPSAAAPSSNGAHSDAWWHGVSVCEQGGRNDPYFGYFSFMDGSQGGRSWSDQVAAGNALLSHVPERESQGGAWADSCINAGYAASPGG